MKRLFLVAMVAAGFANCASARDDEPTSEYIKRDSNRKDVIVFVHGVLGDAKATWNNDDSHAYWPSLVRDDPAFSSANVWVFGYSSPKIKNAQSIEELAQKLGDEL